MPRRRKRRPGSTTPNPPAPREVNGPTLERAAHGLIVASQTGRGYQAISGFDRLYEIGTLDQTAYDAGARYRRDAEVAAGVRAGQDMTGIRSENGPRTPSDAALMAYDRLEATHAAVSAVCKFVLVTFVEHDASQRDIAVALRCRKAGVPEVIKDALDELARFQAGSKLFRGKRERAAAE